MKQDHLSPIIGLTGGIGSGKSTVTQRFNELGIQSVDADDITRDVVAPGSFCLSKIVERFSANILLTDGSLDRRMLRDIIFKKKNERLWLESITHPPIRQRLMSQLANATSKYVLLVHPLLFETGQNHVCRLTISIDTDKETQIKRIIARDTLNERQAKQIIDTQLSNSKRLKQADFIVKNNSNMIDVHAKVLVLHTRILEQLILRA